jgi:broad specificity phosphatase PhoE
MEIVLVRHGQPDWEPGGISEDDPILTSMGRKQAVRTGEALASERFDAIYASPLRRVQQTVAPIAARLGVDVLSESWLREIGMPVLAGKTRDEVQRYFSEAHARDLGAHDEGFPGGESFRHFKERVTAGLESTLLEGHRLQIHENSGHRLWRIPEKVERLLFVAHEGTNSILVSHLLGIEPVPWSWMKFSSAWAGVTRLHMTPIAGSAVWSMESFSDVSHLHGLDDSGFGRTKRVPAI